MSAYISFVSGVFIFCIIMIGMYARGTVYDTLNRRLNSISGTNKDTVVDEDMEKPLNERLFMPIIQSIVKLFGKIVPSNENSKKTEELKRLLRQAGINLQPNEYNSIRLILIIITAVLFYLYGLFMNLDFMMKIAMPLIGAYAAFAVLRFSLSSRVTKRRELMEHQLPDVLDMLSVNVEAGLGFEQAILHIINNFKGPLIDEFNITYREMSMGRSRRDALQLLGTRCDIDDMKSFAGAVIQAGKLGISLKNVLRTQAAAIRRSRRSKVQEKAMKISVKMLIPMVMFILPVIFIVLMGPAVVNIMNAFGGM